MSCLPDSWVGMPFMWLMVSWAFFIFIGIVISPFFINDIDTEDIQDKLEAKE